MKRSRFLKIVSLGAVAGPTLGAAVLNGLSALQPKPNPSDKLILDSIQTMLNAPPSSREYTVHVGSEGMKAFDEALKEYAAWGKEQEEKNIMYNL